MTKLLKPDICVIGGGAGGLTVAAGAAAFGVPVVLVEKGKMGGDCLNYGCVPSKALLAAARRAQQMREAAQFGIVEVDPEIDLRKVQRHVQSVISTIAPNDSPERFAALGVHVVQEEARFRDTRTVIAGEYEIRARRFVIATGSSPFVPRLPGLEQIDYLTNETIFELKRAPRHLLILGGGPVGMEMAQAFRRLGSQVTMVEAATLLGREDPELAAVVIRRLREEGVDIREGSRAMRVEKRGRSGVRLHLEHDGIKEVLDGTHLLIAAGRSAHTGKLGLEEARIRLGETGIEVNERLRTTNRRVYAVGDVAGGPQFTHLAGHQAGLVLRQLLFRTRARENRLVIPRVTYTEPELAQVGLTESEAKGRHRKIAVIRWPYSENDRAQAERQTEGMVKVIAGRGGRILGAGIAGANAGELISLWTLAMAKGLNLRDMADLVPPYPTMSEIGKRAAISYFAPVARRRLVRRIVRLLRYFG